MRSLRTLDVGSDVPAPALRMLADASHSVSTGTGVAYPSQDLEPHGPPPATVGRATERRTGQHATNMQRATGHRSAQEYSESLGADGPVRMEWLHAHAHGEGGSDDADNLAAGGRGANSAMIPAEEAARRNPEPGRLRNETRHFVRHGTYQAEVTHQRYVDNRTGRVVFDQVHDAHRSDPTREEWDERTRQAAHLSQPETLDTADHLLTLSESQPAASQDATSSTTTAASSSPPTSPSTSTSASTPPETSSATGAHSDRRGEREES